MKIVLFFCCFFFVQSAFAQDDYKQYLTLSYEELDSLASDNFQKGKYNLAIPLVETIIKKTQLEKNDSLFATWSNNLALLHVSMGNYEKALPLYIQSKDIREKSLGKEHPHFAQSLNNLALLHQSMGNYDKALPLFIQAKDIIEKSLGKEHPDFALSLNNLATLYRSMGNNDKALPLFIQAKDIYEKSLGKEHRDFALSLHNLAELYRGMGNYEKALPLYLQSKDIREKSLGKEHPSFANSLNSLSELHQSMGNYDKALPLCIQTKDIIEKALGKEHPNFATSLNNLAALHQRMGNYDKALPLYIQAKDIFEKSLGKEHPGFATSLNNLALLHQTMGNYDKALPLYIQAKDIREKSLGKEHPDFATSLMGLAVLHQSMGNYDKALSLFIQAKDIIEKSLGKEHPDFATSLNNLAFLHQKMGNYDKAENNYNQCFAIKNSNLSKGFSWLPEKGKAAYWQQEKGFYEGLNQYAAIAAATFPQATVLAYNSNLIAKGLLLESAKEVEAAALASKDSLTIQIFETLREKRRLINHLVSSGTGKKEIINRYEAEADSLDKILVGRLGEYANSKRKFQITWKEVQNTLSENEAAIEFARYFNEKDSQYYYMALLLRKNYDLPQLIKLGAEKAIAEIPAGKGFADLYKLIWQPIDSFLNGVETVYYSPDGYLNNIAFSALCSQGTEKVVNTKEIKRGSVGKTGSETTNCTFLSERYTLHQLSITRYLAEGLKTSQVDNSLLVFGGVNYDEIPSKSDTLAAVYKEDYALLENISRSSANENKKMEYLPGTQLELENLQKIMSRKKWKIRAYSDKNASENTLKSELKKEVPSILHIATHGFAFPDIVEKKKGFGEENKTYRDADNPMARCGLLLAGANHSWTGNPKSVLAQSGEDAILTALEVSNLPLRKTKLVVLSACETGLGKIQGTEGVFGLKRGFKLAGVEQIIVSLWSVPDKETMELMDVFYNDLAKTHNAVLSFEKAQKDMRKKYSTRPDLWAGFVLVR